MKSVMSGHNFHSIPRANIPRSSFDLTHGYKTTFNGGLLVPVFVSEALPGDTFSVNMSAFARLATPIKPLMDNMKMQSFFFAVPNRLVMENWERFNGQQDNPGDSTDFLIPQLANGVVEEGSIHDYFGIPLGLDFDITGVNALHHRAYAKIWDDWFRDENLQDAIQPPKDDGPDDASIYTLKRRGKRHDYFTSCLPWAQKSEPVSIPIADNVPIETNITGDAGIWARSTTGQPLPTTGTANVTSVDGDMVIQALEGIYDPNGTLIANLSEATAVTINQLREAFQIQKLYERDARGGTRYTSIIQSHFGVISPDSRLQRPEYLGGGTSYVNINPVAQTASDGAGGDTTPQGNLAAFGTMSASGHGFTKSFTEHCVIIGMVCVTADLTYQEGLNRMWSRQTRFDYYWPALSHLGEQPVLNKEIFVQNSPIDDETFGFNERYSEYRYKPSQITGKFRSNYDQSLDIWHLSQDFLELPTLSSDFIEENPPIDRVIAVPDEPHFLFDSYFKVKAARPMPAYAVPGLIDHF